MTSSRRVAAASAVLTGLLALVASGVVPDAPSTATATDKAVAGYFDAHTSMLQWSVVLWSFAAVSLMVFTAFSGALLHELHGNRALRRLATAAGTCAASLILASQATLSFAVREDFTAADPAVRRSVFVITDVMYCALDLVLPAIGLFVGSLALLAVGRLLLPRWLGTLGVVVSACAILGALAPIHGESVGVFEVIEVIGYLLWPLWMLIAGVTLGVRTPDALSSHPA
jgi:hypothetical protein